MKIVLLPQIVSFFLINVIFISCSSIPKTLKEQTLDDMYPLLSEEEYNELNSLNSDKELNIYINEFWQRIDSTSGSSPNEFRKEYEKRLKYANLHYPDRRGWGRSERKRVYLIYGPPSYIEKQEFTDIPISKFSKIKALEIWFYMTPGNNNSLPSQGDVIYHGEKKFLFADMIGSGFFKAIYSSEGSEYFDDRLLLKYEDYNNIR